jgi:hypothetical protein
MKRTQMILSSMAFSSRIWQRRRVFAARPPARATRVALPSRIARSLPPDYRGSMAVSGTPPIGSEQPRHRILHNRIAGRLPDCLRSNRHHHGPVASSPVSPRRRTRRPWERFAIESSVSGHEAGVNLDSGP